MNSNNLHLNPQMSMHGINNKDLSISLLQIIKCMKSK